MATKIINNRVNFASVKNPYPYPDFLDVQLKSFSDFLQLDTPPEERKNDGLYKVFAENFPITDTRNNFVLEFLDYFIDPPRYTIAECLERGLTYSVPLKAKMKLYCTDPDHEDFGTFIQDVSSSAKSSFHVFMTLPANLRPMASFKFFLVTFTSSQRSKIWRMSLSVS